MVKKEVRESSIAIVADDQDICRLIFSKPEDGRYELKISFLKNEFDVNAYRLFANRPIHWNVDASRNHELSYHKGKDNKPITIHLKKTNPRKGEQQYQNLPLRRIQAPNINQLFPIPLMKIEIPKLINPIKYKSKKYHKLIELNGSNVVEIFMVNSSFDFSEYTNKYSEIHFAQFTLSMEIFATNSVISDYQKGGNLIPKGEPEERAMVLPFLDNIKIYAIYYPDQNLDNRLDKINVTFIENELSEDILLMLNIAYSNKTKEGMLKPENTSIFLGGSRLKDLDLPVAPLMRPSIGKHNIASFVLERGMLMDIEKERFYKRALLARINLRDALKEYEVEFNLSKFNLEKKCLSFIEAIEEIHESITKKYQFKDNKEIVCLNDMELWFQTELCTHSEDIHLMLAKYLGLDSCYLYGRKIHGEYEEFHVWLQFDDMFDIDGLYGYLSRYIDEDLPKIIIIKGAGPGFYGDMGTVNEKMKSKGFNCGETKVAKINREKFRSKFEINSKLLDRLYDTIVTHIVINKNEKKKRLEPF